MPPAITAIVPTWNEEENLPAAILSLREGGIEHVRVVDGGSTDRTVDVARGIVGDVLSARGGLFEQLNCGARDAPGDVLLFHYADVLFPAGGRGAIERALEDPGVVGGAFTLAFSSPRRCYRFIAGGARLRNRLGVGPFGDQSIFVRAGAFRGVSGFRPEAFLADLDMVRRVRRAGRFRLLPERVHASVRRWERGGVLPTLLRHWGLTGIHVLGLGGVWSRSRRAADGLREVR